MRWKELIIKSSHIVLKLPLLDDLKSQFQPTYKLCAPDKLDELGELEYD